MHRVTFFPLGDADSYRIDLANGRKVLVDFANMANPDDKTDHRIDLATSLRADLKTVNRTDFDVVAFTHCDDDHVHGAAEFFFLDHAAKYQGEGRIKIKELWVPAAMIIEESLDSDARILRQEARYRLKEGKGVRVFSRPDSLKDWLATQGLSVDDRRSLITDAGQVIPGFSTASDGIEFFVHSPFASRQDGALIDRNRDSLVFQAKFTVDGEETCMLMTDDTTYDMLTDIVNITKAHKRDDRLQWDILKVPHHCSYLALSSEKGKDTTTPVAEVQWLMEQGRNRGLLVSTSRPIPSDDADNQPPHRQAANYYKKLASNIDGEFKVTMCHPKQSAPEPLVITIDGSGATLKKEIVVGGTAVTSRQAPRAGGQHER